MSKLFGALLIVLAISSLCLAATPQTLIFLNSQPGDYIGGGIKQTFTPADGTFTVQNLFNGGVGVNFNTSDFSQFWFLDFGPPTGLTLARGQYEGAQRFAFHAPGKPGIDVSGDGRGCNTDSGRFLVSDIAFATDGTILRLAIDFEQHCEGGTPALYGSVRYNSSVSLVPRLSAGDASGFKGNEGSSDATVTLALSMPSNKTVSAQYATADGSGVQGVDYQTTSGTVVFPPGLTSQTITVPLLGDRLPRGNKIFDVVLSGATGAPLGDSSANVKTIDPNIPLTALAMSGQPGDYIGGGAIYLYTLDDGTFTPTRNFDNGVTMDVSVGDFWEADFAAGDNSSLTRGLYLNAERFPFQTQGVPGLNVSGAGRGCNTLAGDFSILQAAYDSSGNVQHFAADFVQHCEEAQPALYGSVRYKSSLRQVSVSNAVINGSSAVFTVTINPPSTRSVSVSFNTADGTAIAGVDYGATSQTVTFSPGDLEHTVTVPLLSSGGGKTFYGQINAFGGAAVWIRQGSATF